jgi:hypothetical protein
MKIALSDYIYAHFKISDSNQLSIDEARNEEMRFEGVRRQRKRASILALPYPTLARCSLAQRSACVFPLALFSSQHLYQAA